MRLQCSLIPPASTTCGSYPSYDWQPVPESAQLIVSCVHVVLGSSVLLDMSSYICWPYASSFSRHGGLLPSVGYRGHSPFSMPVASPLKKLPATLSRAAENKFVLLDREA
jgi:hypothetical protein